MSKPNESIGDLAAGFAHVATLKPVAKEDPAYVYRSFRDTFETPAGQRVLAWVMQESGIFPPAEEVVDEARLRSAAGRRYLGLWMLRHFSIPPPEPKKPAPEVSPLDRK